MAELTYRGVDIRRTDRSIFFDLVQGFDDEALVRGEDDVIPGAAGRAVGERTKDVRRIELRGFVFGTDPANYRALVTELHTIFNPTLTPGALVIGDQYLGIAAATTKTINARYVNAMWGDMQVGKFRTVSVELESVSSPPEWT